MRNHTTPARTAGSGGFPALLGLHGWTGVLVVLATVALYAVAWPTLHLTHDVPAALQPLIAGLAALPFLLVRANPALGWALSAGSALLVRLAFDTVGGWGWPWQVVHFLVLFALLVATAVTAPPQVVGLAWLGTTVLFAAHAPVGAGPGWALGVAVLAAFGLMLRWVVRSRRALARQEQVSDLERARRTVLEERARIARDLHDIVAHQMSMIVVQAQSAPYRITGVPEAARAEFEQLAQSARTALNEVRGLLGVLRSDGADGSLAPQPGLPELVELLKASRAAGMPLSWTVAGPSVDLGGAAGLTLFRLTQESLANASRHAPGAPVSVRLAFEPRVATLEVVNKAPAAAPRHAGGGHGIAGMRERAAAIGGTVTAQARPDGGFEVRAVLPLDPGGPADTSATGLADPVGAAREAAGAAST